MQPTADEPTTGPVGPSIAALLDEAQAFQATTATELTTAPVHPSIAAMLDEGRVFQATAVAEPTTARLSPSIVALANHAYQATTATMRIPSPVEIGETMHVSTEAIAVTSAPLKSRPAHTVMISQQGRETRWRPLLQVDRVVWPSIHNRLQTTAAAAIQQMADGLLSICSSGCKVLGLASCSGGEGVTTLLIAAARNLLSQGRKVVLVDANWSNPQLAQSMGLLPQIGWEETLCGGLPLEEVVIESLADGLAVLPVREPSASTITQAQIAASFEILTREFDVVLVDLGPLVQFENEDTSLHEGAPSRDVAARMDAVILVQNVRVTTPNRLADVHQRLAASNLRHAGTIQNFVAG
jgi:Mrp family chromosome partitioning ATPase